MINGNGHIECPKCGASRKILRESLRESGENRDLACLIIRNCKVCWRELGHLVETQVMTIEQFNKEVIE